MSLDEQGRPCPSCRLPMTTFPVPRNQRGMPDFPIDACGACRCLWFDGHESTMMSPDGVISLFRMAAFASEQTKPLAAKPLCPECSSPLITSFDIVKSGRFSYMKCPAGHGRMTPFSQFLTEKGFVRPLSNAEKTAWAPKIGVVLCPSCGAPVDIRNDLSCPHCKSPVSVLDPAAVKNALNDLYIRQAQKSHPDLHAPKSPAGAFPRDLSDLESFVLGIRDRPDTPTDILRAGLSFAVSFFTVR